MLHVSIFSIALTLVRVFLKCRDHMLRRSSLASISLVAVDGLFRFVVFFRRILIENERGC